ncbi:MAG TPA: hypothetical protein EYM69_10605 [Dehalococcoidia bacterium]|nr:hypothetical protein [Dehalococcoidia bacterium]
MTQHDDVDPAITEMWREVLVEGHRDMPASLLPGHPRCGMCMNPAWRRWRRAHEVAAWSYSIA